MVKGELWHETHSRFKLKETKKSIARVVGLSIQTVRKILRQKQPQGYAREQQESEVLKPYKDYILQRLAAVAYCAQAIFEGDPGSGLSGELPDRQAVRQPFAEGSGHRSDDAVRDAAGSAGPGRLGPVLDDNRGQKDEGPSLRPNPGLQPPDVRRSHDQRGDYARTGHRPRARSSRASST